MTLEIGAAVESGEIVNTCPNQVHGWLRLAGHERPLYLNLTGNLSADLAGRRLAFTAAPPTGGGQARSAPPLSRQQIGPTGDMTRLSPRLLLLEWQGQNGLVLCRARLQDCEQTDPEPLGGCEALPRQSPGEGLFRLLPSLAGLDAPPSTAPASWDQQFDLLDSMLEDTDSEVPIRSLLSPLLELPPPGTLSGEALEIKVKEVLAHLALLGVCLEMCHHFSAAEAYRLLWQVTAEDKLHPQSPASGYVMHYLTFEHCQACVAEEETWVQQEESSR